MTQQNQALGARLAILERKINILSRVSPFVNASVENTSVSVYDDDGSLRALIGQQADGTTAVNVTNGPAPAAPSAPVLASILGGVSAAWDGTFADGSPTPLDFARVEIHASPESGFTPDATTLQGTLESPRGGTLSVPSSDIVYVLLLARNTSGTASAPSAQAGPMGPSEVVASDVLDGIITTIKLADDAVTSAKVAVGAIDSDAIAAAAVTAAALGAGAVTAAALAAAAVTPAALDTGAVTAAALAADAVTGPAIAAGAVTAGSIAAGAITAGKIAANAVTATSIAADAVTAGAIAANAVTAGTIAAGVVDATAIAAGAVSTAKLAAGAVTASTIAAGTILASNIAAGAIDATVIAAGSVTTTALAALSVTGAKIAANTITAGNIAAGSITAASLSATAIDGKTITGATMETSAGTGARIVIDGPSNTLSAYYDDGNIAWLGQTEDANGLFSFSDDDSATVQSSALLNGALFLSAGDLRLENVPNFAVNMYDTTTGAASFSCNDATGEGGSVAIDTTNASFGMAALFPSNEEWVTPTLGSGWSFSNIRSSLPLRYRIDSEDNLIIKGSVSCTTTTPATTIFSVVAPYLPKGAFSLQQVVIFKQSSAGTGYAFGHGFITAGAVEQNGLTFASGDIVSFDASWPLGNLA